MDISAYWKDTLAQDRQAMAGYFRPDAVIRWHCTNEQFTVPEFIRANCEYPGEWDGKIERTERSGDLSAWRTEKSPPWTNTGATAGSRRPGGKASGSAALSGDHIPEKNRSSPTALIRCASYAITRFRYGRSGREIPFSFSNARIS